VFGALIEVTAGGSSAPISWWDGANRQQVAPRRPHGSSGILHLFAVGSQPELGSNSVSLRVPNQPLSGCLAFLDHLGLKTLFKTPRKLPRILVIPKNPLNGARQ
jgi:hypothetical protein